MGFILTKAIKPPQTPPKSQVKSYPASHQNLARSGPCQAWARHGPALAWPGFALPGTACSMAKLQSHVAWPYLSFHYATQALGLNLIILLGKIIENIKTFI